MDMDRLAIDNCSTRDRATIRDTAFAQGRCRRNQAKVSDVASDFAVYSPHYSVGCVTESRSSLGNRIEYRLKLCRRAGDHAKDLARGRLLLQRLAKFSCLRGDGFLQLRKGLREIRWASPLISSSVFWAWLP